MRLARVVDGLLNLASQHTELLALLLHERETGSVKPRSENAATAERLARQWDGQLPPITRGH